MGERIELRVHDFLVEGRDESKSHVLIEIAEPSPNEVSTHGHFFAVAELSGATPKTIQMVRAWIEFAIDSYYKSVPTNIELHFETIMGLLNTQSSLYLKQHANEVIHIAIASVCNGALYLAVHGRPTALLLYNKDGSWQTMDLVDETAVDAPGQLFSNVVTGVMRVDDRFLIATPRVIEFFSADRLTKISEGKTLEEVNEHMQRILADMQSDYSFAAVWLRLVRAFDETKEIMQHKIAPPEQPAPAQRIEKKADTSMTELFNKAKSTAAILAPPVLTIPKDKIITNILKLAQRSVTTSGKAVVSATQTSISYLKTERGRAAIEKINQKISPRSYFENIQQQLISNFSALPIKRKQALMIAVGGVVVALGFFTTLGVLHIQSVSNQKIQAELSTIEDTIHAADQSFVYQNEPAARASLTDAETAFAALSKSVQDNSAGVATHTELIAEHNKILHISVATLTPLALTSDLTITDLARNGATLIALQKNGALATIKDSVKQLGGTFTNSTALFYDDQNKRAIIAMPNNKLSAVTLNDGHASDIQIDWLAENTRADAITFYSGRTYVFDNNTHTIYRYDSSGDGATAKYTNGKKWITDSGKPTDIVALTADTSIWLRTATGAVLKYTAGKLQPFHISNITPDVTHIGTIISGTSNNVYFLDDEQHRVVVTDRDGKMLQQYQYDAATSLTRLSIDKNETTATGVTDDGRIVSFALSK